MPRAQTLCNWPPCGPFTQSYFRCHPTSCAIKTHSVWLETSAVGMSNRSWKTRRVHRRTSRERLWNWFNQCRSLWTHEHLFEGCKPKHLFASIFHISDSLMHITSNSIWNIYRGKKPSQSRWGMGAGKKSALERAGSLGGTGGPRTALRSYYDVSLRLTAPLSHLYLSLSLYSTRGLVEGT